MGNQNGFGTNGGHGSWLQHRESVQKRFRTHETSWVCNSCYKLGSHEIHCYAVCEHTAQFEEHDASPNGMGVTSEANNAAARDVTFRAETDKITVACHPVQGKLKGNIAECYSDFNMGPMRIDGEEPQKNILEVGDSRS